MRPRKLLNIDENPKTVKGQKKGYMTAVLYLAPGDLSGFQVCPMASKGCLKACLNTAGRAGILKAGETTNAIQKARIARTKWYFEDRSEFMRQLFNEISAFERKALRKGLKPAVRLNGTSDIPWERIKVDPEACDYFKDRTIFDEFPEVQFYDYTKITKRMLAFCRGEMPRNYHLSFSLTEEEQNHSDAIAVLREKGTVVGVFARPCISVDVATWSGSLTVTTLANIDRYAPTINGDETDLRFLDEPGHVVYLKAKGKARKDTSGFVRP